MVCKLSVLDRGVNPFVVDYDGTTPFQNHGLGHLSNIPPQKSVFFTTRPIEGKFKGKTNFPAPWCYGSGVFDGKFEDFIGKGAVAVVLSGQWFGKKAAFKGVVAGSINFDCSEIFY